jgi:hypothetical protein
LCYIFPIIILIGYLSSIGLYLIVPVNDKFNKTRYMLNFAGMRSSSYYIGLFLADFLIYSIGNILLVGFVFVLDLGVFTENAGNLLIILTVLGFPYITLAYLFGFLFENDETAFKWVFWMALATYLIPVLLEGKYMPKGLVSIFTLVFRVSSPFISFNDALSEIGKTLEITSVFSRITNYLCYQMI